MANRGFGVVILATLGACSGSGNGPGAGGGAVDPSGTQGWTWQECGRIPATPAVDASKSIRFVPDGRALAYTRDGRALLFQPAEPSAPPAILGPVEGSLAFSRDGALVAASTGAAFVIRRVADGTMVRELPLPVDGATPCSETVALSTSGAHLLARGEDGMCIYDLAARRVTARLPFSWGTTTFLGDTEELVAVTTFAPSVGFTVVRLDTSGAELGRAVIPRDAGVWLSPDGNVAASVMLQEEGAPTCALWSTIDGKELWSARAPADASWTGVEPAFSPRGDLAALCGAVVRTADGAHVRDIISRAAALEARNEYIAWRWASTVPSLAPDGRHLLGQVTETSVDLLDLDTATTRRLGGGHTAGATSTFISLAVSRDGKVLVSSAAEMLGWKLAARFEESTATWLAPHVLTRPRLDVAADGSVVAISGDGGLLFDVTTAALLPLKWSTDALESLSSSSSFCWPELRLSGDGRWRAGLEWDHTLRVRHAEAPQDTVVELETGCVRVAISPDSQLLATSRGAVYGLESGEELVAGSGGALNALGATPSVWSDSVEFSPDQTQFLVSSECSGAPRPTTFDFPVDWYTPPVCARVELHATSDGRLLHALPKNMGRYPSFSPDGSWIVAGGGLYHVPTATARPLEGDVRVAAFTPDGDIIAGDAASNLIRYCRR